MAWMPKSDAATAMDLSPLVLSRQIAVGKFQVKTVGRRVLVHVPDHHKREKNASVTPSTIVRPRGAIHIATALKNGAMGETATAVISKLRQLSVDAAEDERHPKKPETQQATGESGISISEDGQTGGVAESVPDLAQTVDELRNDDVISAAIDPADRSRVMCEKEIGAAREDADRAWRSCERAERRLRQVAWVTVSVLIVVMIGAAWLEKAHTRQLQAWSARVAKLDAALKTVESREDGEIDGLQSTLSAFRDDAAQARDEAAEARNEADKTRDELQAQLMGVRSDLAATRVELDHVCWERDEAMRDRDRLTNEVAAQRDHIEKMQSTRAEFAARSLQQLIDESWNIKSDALGTVDNWTEPTERPATAQRISKH